MSATRQISKIIVIEASEISSIINSKFRQLSVSPGTVYVSNGDPRFLVTGMGSQRLEGTVLPNNFDFPKEKGEYSVPQQIDSKLTIGFDHLEEIVSHQSCVGMGWHRAPARFSLASNPPTPPSNVKTPTKAINSNEPDSKNLSKEPVNIENISSTIEIEMQMQKIIIDSSNPPSDKILHDQIKLRSEFLEELKRNNDNEESPLKLKVPQGMGYLLRNVELYERELSALKSKIGTRPATHIAFDINNFDRSMRILLFNSHPKIITQKESEDYISDEMRSEVIDSLRSEKERLFSNYKFIDHNIDPRSIVGQRLKKIDDLCKKLEEYEYNPARMYDVYQGKKTAMISKKDLITDLTNLKAEMNSTGRKLGMITRNKLFFVKGVSEINKIINKVQPKVNSGFLEMIKIKFRK